MRFFIVDAFADELFGGNPAGVVLIPDGEPFPEDETMRKTAAELRYSETAFIRMLGGNEFEVRYFTPAAEVDLCGHATIASFYVLNKEGHIDSGIPCIARTKAGALAIDISGESVFMEMGEARSLGVIDEKEALDELYGVMGIEAVVPEADGVPLFPELVSTGLPDIMLAVSGTEALAAIRPDFSALSALSERYSVTGVHAFCRTDDPSVLHCRNFAPLYDIDEEAATGTANGALTYYLYRKGLAGDGDDLVFLQGEAMDRPSEVRARLSLEQRGIRIQVGGPAVILAEGCINL